MSSFEDGCSDDSNEDDESTLKYFQAVTDFLQSAVDCTDTLEPPAEELTQLLKDLKKDVKDYFSESDPCEEQQEEVEEQQQQEDDEQQEEEEEEDQEQEQEEQEEEWALERSVTPQINEFNKRIHTQESVSPHPTDFEASEDSDRQSQYKRLCKCSDEEFLEQIKAYEGCFKETIEYPNLFAHGRQTSGEANDEDRYPDRENLHIHRIPGALKPTRSNIKHTLLFERAVTPDVTMHEVPSLGGETNEVARIKLVQRQIQRSWEAKKPKTECSKRFRMARGIPRNELEPCEQTNPHAMMLKDGSFVKRKQKHVLPRSPTDTATDTATDTRSRQERNS